MCNEYATYRGKCDSHKTKYVYDTNKTELSRSNDTFYKSKQWRDVRLKVLTTQPLCRYCERAEVLTEATVVDHIIRRSHYQGSPYDMNNLQPLCVECHNRKTQREQQYYDNNTYNDKRINIYYE